jgi:hypothetical protein
MNKKLPFLLLLLFFFCWNSEAQLSKKVLFLGNSYTEVNNVPSMISSMANSTGDILTYDWNTPGGHRFMHHVANATSLAKINADTWDYVVLQGQSQETSFSQNQLVANVYPHAATLSNLIRQNNPCSQPLFYMTWGRQNGDSGNCQVFPWVCTYEGMDNAIRNSYLHMALVNNAELAPAGAVWRYIRQNHPGINLYSSDESHPSLEGSYAAACALYTMIYKKDPTLITWHSNISATVANTIKLAAKTVVFDAIDTWNFTVNPANATFTESINGGEVTFTNASINNDILSWDFGDGTTSEELNPVHIYTTSGIYTVTLTATKCGKSNLLSKTYNINTNLHADNITVLKEFTLFPNPTMGKINIAFPETKNTLKLEIYDVRGTLLLTQNTLNTRLVEVNVSALQAGVYLVKLQVDGVIAVKRFVKE